MDASAQCFAIASLISNHHVRASEVEASDLGIHYRILMNWTRQLAEDRRPEGLRHVPAGKLGKVVGLDRVPEVRTLRKKLEKMATIGSLPEAERPAQLLPMAKPSAHCWPTSQKPPSNTPKPEPEWSIN